MADTSIAQIARELAPIGCETILRAEQGVTVVTYERDIDGKVLTESKRIPSAVELSDRGHAKTLMFARIVIEKFAKDFERALSKYVKEV